MKSKLFTRSLIICVIFIFTLTFAAFGQGIQWLTAPSEAVTLTNSTPGDTTSVTLRFKLSDGADLTNGQWLEIDLSSFQILSSQASNCTNFVFTSSRTAGGDTIDMDNDVTDFTSTLLSNNIIKISLTNELSFVPDDTVYCLLTVRTDY